MILPKMTPSPLLTTDRLLLRHPISLDSDAISTIAGDWEVARHLGRVPHPYRHSHLQFFFDQVIPNEPTWAIVWRQTDQLVGIMGLAPSSDNLSAELGYYVARDHWGNGIATEAGQAIVQFGLESIGYCKLTASYHVDNPASGRVLAKLGFVVVGSSTRPCLAERCTKASIEVELKPFP